MNRCLLQENNAGQYDPESSMVRWIGKPEFATVAMFAAGQTCNACPTKALCSPQVTIEGVRVNAHPSTFEV